MKKHKRALSLLLIICIMCCAFFGSLESSNALVLNPWTIALCGTILCAMGLTFTDTSAFEAAANSFASSLDAHTLTFIIDGATTLASGVSDGIFTVTQSIVDALMNWLVSVSPEGGSVVINSSYVSCSGLSVPYYSERLSGTGFSVTNAITYDDLLSVSVSHPSFKYPVVPFPIYNSNGGKVNGSYLVLNDSINKTFYVSYIKDDGSLNGIGKDYSALSFCYVPSSVYGSTSTYTLACSLAQYNSKYDFSSPSVFWNEHYITGQSLALSSATSIPFDDVWAPGSSDEEKALVAGTDVVVPGGLVNSDGVLASDVIVGMSAANVRANSGVNTDVVAGTGTITGTGEGTGIFEGIGSLVLDIPIIGTIASTLSGILEAIRGFFDVSKFDLNFDSLKIGLTKVFPFCIPFDFFNAIKMFSSDASAFVFDINLETEYFTIDHTVDLTPFRLPILFFRYVVVFWFGFILISRTKDFMKW